MARPGEIYGTAGASLGAANFGMRGAVGRIGEQKSAAEFAELAQLGPTVLHDLRIPIPGFKANIDHAVVSGRTITLVDTKVWRAGFYWTLGGRTRRGLTRASHCDKKTLPTGVDGIKRHLHSMGVDADFNTSVLLIRSPGIKRPNFTLYRPAGARVIHGGDGAVRRLARHTGKAPAHPQVVAALNTLLYR